MLVQTIFVWLKSKNVYARIPWRIFKIIFREAHPLRTDWVCNALVEIMLPWGLPMRFIGLSFAFHIFHTIRLIFLGCVSGVALYWRVPSCSLSHLIFLLGIFLSLEGLGDLWPIWSASSSALVWIVLGNIWSSGWCSSMVKLDGIINCSVPFIWLGRNSYRTPIFPLFDWYLLMVLFLL